MLRWLAWLRNELDFPIRRVVRWRRSGARLPSQPKEGLYTDAEAIQTMERLVSQYGLQEWAQRSGRKDFAASLFYLEMIERALTESGARLPDPVEALDAGCGDWFYAQVLFGLLRGYGTENPRSVSLDGVEIDAFRLYEGFHSRYDWAMAYSEGLEGARYLPGDLRAYRRPVDLAFMLFPFLFDADLRRWGLPRRYLRPAEYLAHVASLVKPGGLLVIANLGEGERALQHRLLQEAGLPIVWWSRHRSPLFQYRQDRFITVVRP